MLIALADCKLLKDWIKILGPLGAFAVGLYQYIRAQRWRRREFIAAQIKDFEADKQIQAALAMLDWNDRRVAFHSEIGESPVILRVSDELLCSALLPDDKANGYSDNEMLIRDSFDRFLDGLVRFWNFVDAGLISVGELEPYLSYWMLVMSASGKMKDWHIPAFNPLLYNYLQIYHFEGAARLLKKFGYNVGVSDGALEDAITNTLSLRAEANRRAEDDQRERSQGTI